jgi:hypothetical protein
VTFMSARLAMVPASCIELTLLLRLRLRPARVFVNPGSCDPVSITGPGESWLAVSWEILGASPKAWNGPRMAFDRRSYSGLGHDFADPLAVRADGWRLAGGAKGPKGRATPDGSDSPRLALGGGQRHVVADGSERFLRA